MKRQAQACSALCVLMLMFAPAPSLTAVGQFPAAPSEEELTRRRAKEAEWEQTMERIRIAGEEYRRRWNEIFQQTEPEREAYDRSMRDYSDRFSKPARTSVQTMIDFGDDGLPESGEVWWVNRDSGAITHRAAFDAEANPGGFVQTPSGKALEALPDLLPDGVDASGLVFSKGSGPDGRSYINYVQYSTADGRTGRVDFNARGEAYRGRYFQDGALVDEFHHPELEPRAEPPRALPVPPLVRPVTQPCEPCREAAETFNDIVREMNELRNVIADLVGRNANSRPGLNRMAIEREHEARMDDWAELAPAYEAVRAALFDCAAACARPPEPEQPSAAVPNAFTLALADGSTIVTRPAPGPVDERVQLIIIIDLAAVGIAGSPELAMQAAGRMASAPRSRTTFATPSDGPRGGPFVDLDPPAVLPPWIRSAALVAGVRPARRASVAVATWPGQSPSESLLSLVATGQSSGEVFRLVAHEPVAGTVEVTAPSGLVVQPIAESADDATGSSLLQRVVGYCLDFTKPPPREGVRYQVAPEELQQRFRPLRHLASAAQQLFDAGRLRPDSNPAGYLDFIKQWSIWSAREQWDVDAFGEAFVRHTETAVTAAGQPWTSENEAGVRAAIPNRWRDIQQVARAAAPLIAAESR